MTEPWLLQNDKEMFYKYLDRATIYFEYGSGGSTYQASVRKNIKQIYSVESDLVFQNKLKDLIKNPNTTFILNEMRTETNKLGYPGKSATKEQKINYSSHLPKISENQSGIDLILIDGRFRVACCLKCYEHIDNNCFIAFDDFFNRPYYHTVLDFFEIVDRTTDNRMVILKKKDGVSIPADLIAKYELDPR